MTIDRLRDDLMIAVALAEFSYRHQDTDAELARRAWVLADKIRETYDLDSYQSIDALRVVDELDSADGFEPPIDVE
ncbi:hypothetical protein [Natrinema saccharevitans]|uniref:hypothetical protein n=1 Tax=Natrinema saccharevitans TaxID=301967 RepID=UPI001FE40E41|nr:hypothetical protein [Natrinema saccharevitans]